MIKKKLNDNHDDDFMILVPNNVILTLVEVTIVMVYNCYR